MRHPVPDGSGRLRLTLDEVYLATYHFIAQYYAREPITPFMLMLVSMQPDRYRQVGDPATWDD